MTVTVAEVNVRARLTIDAPLTLKRAGVIRRGLIDDIRVALVEAGEAYDTPLDVESEQYSELAEAIADRLIDFGWVTEGPPADDDDADLTDEVRP